LYVSSYPNHLTLKSRVETFFTSPAISKKFL
jgi:hypothetical protein